MGNTIGGGDSGGLVMAALYCSAPFRVRKPDSAPTASESRIHTAYVFQVRFSCIVITRRQYMRRDAFLYVADTMYQP